MADGNNAIISPISDVFFSPLAPTTPDQAYQQCQAVDITNLQNQFPLFMGAPWLCGQHIFTHVSGPNSRRCGFFLFASRRDAAQQPAPRRRQSVTGRRLGPVHQGLDQFTDLAWSGHILRRRDHQRRQLLNEEEVDCMIGTIEPRADDLSACDHGDRALTRYGTLGVIVACLGAMLALMLSGCSGAAAHAVDPSRANDALVTALDHWKAGDDPGSLSSSSTPMTVQDFDWQGGAKLIDYQLLGEGQARDANLSVKVKLTLQGTQGKSKTVQKTVYYLVGTSPSVTVFRDMLKR